MRDHLVAVDVGTTSARAGIFRSDGLLLAKARFPIRMQRGRNQHAEHASEDIWSAVCQAVRSALQEAGVVASQVAAVGFDATCSLVVRDSQAKPLAVSLSGDESFDTVVWLDHRAIEQAERLNAGGHPILQYSGGSLSPEMQIPKLMWLKENMPDRWAKIGYLFDLADFLTWRSTGLIARSQCTLTAKWNFLGHEQESWNAEFLKQAGLEDLLERGNLPPKAQAVGAAIGPLTPSAASELGLDTACLVAPGLIDAYAGALGVLGAAAKGGQLRRNLALIGGTSSCLVAFSESPIPGRSLWGPYFEAGYPGYWLVEGSQSATGALLDHVVRMHAAGGEPTADLHDRIVRRIGELRTVEGSRFGDEIHILPDFHGNRSPLADPRATGVISGLTLDTSFDGLCRLYWRACVAIMLGLRHILETMQGFGYATDTLHLAGGHVNNPLLVELCADVTNCRVRVPAARDAVLLGSAMVAAVSAGLHVDLAGAGEAMDQGGHVQLPDPARRADYDRDYRRFLAMHRHRTELEAIQ